MAGREAPPDPGPLLADILQEWLLLVSFLLHALLLVQIACSECGVSIPALGAV